MDILTYEGGITSFIADPNNGDILMSDFQGTIWRLVEDKGAVPDIPATLTETGAYAELTNLVPNPGIYPYDVNLRFWSDHASKQRLFSIPNPEDQMIWDADNPWEFPVGMFWVKHFELEMERGNPETKKRVETRFLVKTKDGVYGLSYRWNETQDEAFLVDADGITIDYIIDDQGEQKLQTWQIPSRADCLQCHTDLTGGALSFNTRQLNRLDRSESVPLNQLSKLENAGYFQNQVTALQALPRFVKPSEIDQSLDARVRSYLAVNCVSCHQPGGSGGSTWDARPQTALEKTGLIHGIPSNDGGNPQNRLIVPGDLNKSILYSRLTGCCGFTRMPPLATNELDETAIELVEHWIDQLSSYQTYQEWRIDNFGNDTSPEGTQDFDADFDGYSNYTEFLTQTDPRQFSDHWSHEVEFRADNAIFTFDQMANRSFQLESSTDLENWIPWDLPGNAPTFPSDDLGEKRLEGPLTTEERQRFFYRWRIREP